MDPKSPRVFINPVVRPRRVVFYFTYSPYLFALFDSITGGGKVPVKVKSGVRSCTEGLSQPIDYNLMTLFPCMIDATKKDSKMFSKIQRII